MINIVAGMMGAMLLPAIQTGLTPLMNMIRQSLYDMYPNQTLDLHTLMQMKMRGVISHDIYTKEAKRNGIEENLATLALQSQKNWVGAVDLITLWRREKIDESDLDERLERLAYSPTQIRFLKQATEFFPNAQDLVRFAVREVYDDSTREEFKMDEDRPQKFLDEAAKAGVTEDQAKNYWAAHWELPGLREGFEMLYRTEFDEGKLDKLMKAKDIMPIFRPYLKQIAYQPLTRVDVRRMHNLGVLNDAQVKTAYQHIGYSPENAQRMLDFTIEYNTDEAKGMSRAVVLRAFDRNLIDKNQLKSYLTDMNYTGDIIEFWLSMAAWEKEQAELMADVDSIRSQVRMNQITKEDGNNALLGLGQPATFTQSIMKEIERDEKETVRMPTKTDLLRWLNEQVIDEGAFSSTMRKIGYKSGDIQLYLTEAALKTAGVERRYLGIVKYQGWLKQKILTTEEFITIARERDISEEDTGRMIDETQEV